MRADKRRCEAANGAGEACRAAPMRGGRFCFWHSPEHADEATEARRLGGQRRRREAALAGTYELDGLSGIELAERIIYIAVTDTLALENSVARSRALAQLAGQQLRVAREGELEARIEALEEALNSSHRQRRQR